VAVVIEGAVVFGVLLAAAAGLFRHEGLRRTSPWRFVGVAVAGNLVLVLSTGTLPGLLGLTLMLGGLGGLLVRAVSGRRR
jgi:hypothetical protein